MKSFSMQLQAPFDAVLSLHFWRRKDQEQVDLVDDSTYTRLFFRGDRPVLLHLQLGQDINKPAALISLSGKTESSDTNWAMETARWILNDSTQLNAFYSHIQQNDPALVPITKRLHGLRPLQSPAVFDTMVFAIVGQQVNVNFAYQCKIALENRYSRKAEIEGKTYCAGLQPEDFNKATVEEMREMKLSNSKTKTILGLAEAFRHLSMDRSMLVALSDEEVETSLTKLWGIGPWTVRYTQLRALARNDVLPTGDAGLRNAIHQVYGLDGKPTPEVIEKTAEAWRPYRSLATYYLWHRNVLPSGEQEQEEMKKEK